MAKLPWYMKCKDGRNIEFNKLWIFWQWLKSKFGGRS
jgi:hypothetical protein